MADRVYAGDDEQYFPDLGAWLKPGDPVPAGAPDDERFVTKAGKSKSTETQTGAAAPADTEE